MELKVMRDYLERKEESDEKEKIYILDFYYIFSTRVKRVISSCIRCLKKIWGAGSNGL